MSVNVVRPYLKLIQSQVKIRYDSRHGKVYTEISTPRKSSSKLELAIFRLNSLILSV